MVRRRSHGPQTISKAADMLLLKAGESFMAHLAGLGSGDSVSSIRHAAAPSLLGSQGISPPVWRNRAIDGIWHNSVSFQGCWFIFCGYQKKSRLQRKSHRPSLELNSTPRRKKSKAPGMDFLFFSSNARWEDVLARGVLGNAAEHMERWITPENNVNRFNAVVMTLTKPKSEKLPC